MKARFTFAVNGWWIESDGETWFSATGSELTETQKTTTFEYAGIMVTV